MLHWFVRMTSFSHSFILCGWFAPVVLVCKDAIFLSHSFILCGWFAMLHWFVRMPSFSHTVLFYVDGLPCCIGL